MAERKKSPKRPGRNGFKYRPQFGVIVICENERHQKTVFDQLKSAGHTVRVVSV